MIIKLLVFIVVVVLAVFALRMYMPTLGDSAAAGFEQRDGETKLRDCPDTPNCQGSESARAPQQVDRIAISSDAENVMDTLVSVVSAQPGAAVFRRDDTYVHFTFTSSLMHYVDDVEMLISDDKQSVQVRSASRLGKSDLGANAKRVELLRAALSSL